MKTTADMLIEGHVLPVARISRAASGLALLALVLVTSGCASSTSFGVTYDSTPQGAALVCAGVNRGYTPVTTYFDRKALEGYTTINNGCVAIWSSGARAEYEPIPWQQFGAGVTVTKQRPDVPGIQQDMEFALKVEQARNQQQYLQQQQYQQASQPNSEPTVNCTKFGDLGLSRQIYQFKGTLCPLGYLPSN